MDRDKVANRAYGRACVNCSQNKCKCVPRKEDNECERSVKLRFIGAYLRRTNLLRCYRLKKECRPSNGIRRRGQKKAGLSKAVELEEKIKDLTSLLEEKIYHSRAIYGAGHESSAGVNPSSTSSADSEIDGTSMTRGCVGANVSSGTSNFNSSTSSPSNALPLLDEICPLETNEAFTTFLSEKLKYFPFAHIPSTTTARQLRQQLPFLYLCMTLSSRSISHQQAQDNRIRHIVAERLLFKSEQNLDLFLGLLAYIGWHVLSRLRLIGLQINS